MQTILLKAKLHQARVTHAVLEYEGSCAIDGNLLDLAGMHEYEQIHIYNLNNGKRFSTYIIRGEAGSGIISLNGAAAHMAEVGDRIIICAYAHFSEEERIKHKPALVYLTEGNQVTHTSNAIPVQVS